MQRHEQKNGQENKYSDKIYSPSEIERIKSLQDLRKRYISQHKTLVDSAKALGESRAIDIKKKSAENLKNVKERLKKGTLLPESDLLILAKEKKADTILTPKEIPLFETLINKRYILQHTTSATSLEKIEAKQLMLDPKELERRGIGAKQATPDYCGIEQNIFFGIGSRHSSLPKFVRSPTNYESGKPEDYATLQLDYTELMHANPHVASSIWASGHFAHYLASASSSTAASVGIPLLSLFALVMSVRMEPVTLGDTTFAWMYKDKSAEQKAKDAVRIANPLFRTQNKVLVFERQKDDEDEGIVINQTLDIDDEIAAGSDILPFLAYSFIERLRFLGGSMREYLLDHPDDHYVIDNVMEKFFRVDDFELHIPSQLPLSPAFTTTITPQKRKTITEAVRQASAAGDIKTLETLKNQGYPLDGYMYEDPYRFDNTPATELPLVATMKAGHIETINWLIIHGAHRSAFKKSDMNTPQLIDSADDDHILFTTALETGNVAVLECLVSHGLDINFEYKDQLRYKQSAKPVKEKVRAELADELSTLRKKAGKEYKSRKSDKLFLQALRATAITGNLPMLDVVIKLSDYAQNPKVQKERLVYDAAAAGDLKVFQHMLARFGETNTLNYTDLFIKAAENNNLALMSYFYSLANITTSLPETREAMQALREKKFQQFMDHEKKTQIDPLDLHDLAIERLKNGQFEAGEWLLAKSSPIRDQDVGAIALEIDDEENDTLEARIRWLVSQARIDPSKTIKKYEFEENGEKTTLLSLAIKKQKNDLAKWLMTSFHIDPCAPLGTNKSPFAEALENDNLALAEQLLSQGANLPQDAATLKHIIKEKEVKTLQWLIAHGASITDEEVIITAMTEGTPEIMDLLVTGKAQLPSAEKSKELFNKAIESKNVGMLEWLSKKYSFEITQYHDAIIELINKENTPIMMLEETLHWLLTHGWNPSLPDATGVTLLDKILLDLGFFTSMHLQRLKYLKLHGVDVDTALKDHGTDALMRAISTDCSMMGSMLGDNNTAGLIAMGVPVNKVFTRDNPAAPCEPITPLEYASSMGGKLKIVRELVDAGAKPDLIHNENLTALHLACGQSLGNNNRFRFREKCKINPELIKLLLKANAPVNIGQESPLTVLCKQINPPVEALEVLLSAGANPNYGAPQSPLYAALATAEKPTIAVIETLLKAGANPDQMIPEKEMTIRDLVKKDYPDLCAVFVRFNPEQAKAPHARLFSAAENNNKDGPATILEIGLKK